MNNTSDIDPQTIETGTRIRVRALKPVRVGRNNRAAVRKGQETIAVATEPNGYARIFRIEATVDDMGDGYETLWDFEIIGLA